MSTPKSRSISERMTNKRVSTGQPPRTTDTFSRKWVALTWSTLSLRQLLTLLVLVTALPLLTLAMVMSAAMISAEREASRDVLMNGARTLASLVDNEIDTHLAVAATLATSPALQSGDLAAFKKQALQALAVVPGSWINLSDPAGQNVMSTLLADGEALPQRNSRSFSQQVWASRQPQVSDVWMGSITKRQNAILEMPVFKDGAPLYSIIIGLDPNRFLALLRENYSPQTVVGIVDRKLNFVARLPDHEKRVGTAASGGWRASMARAPEGFSENKTLEGEESITPYVKTKYGWTVGIAHLKRVTDAPARRMNWTLALLGGALVLASIVLGVGLSRRLVGSMASLLEASRTIADGKTFIPQALAFHEATQISQGLSATSQTLVTRTTDLRSARDTFYKLVQQAPFGIYLIDAEFKIAQTSQGAEHAFINVQPVIGRDLDEVLKAIWPEPFATKASGRFRHTMATGEPYHQSSLVETRLDTGVEECFDWQIERVVLPDGAFGVVCYFYDLTALRQAQAAVREGDLFAKTVLEASPDCLKIGGLDGRLQYINSSGACLLNIDNCDAVIGQPWESLWPAAHSHIIRNAIDQAKAGRASRFTAETFAEKGTQKFWDVTVAPIMGANGQPVKFFSASRDVTEAKAAEAAVRASETQFRSLADAMPQLAWTAGPDGFIRWYNQGWYRYTGTTPEQMEGWGWQSVHDPAVLPAVLERWKASIANGDPFEMTFPLRGADGVFRSFLTRIIPVKDAHGHVQKWFGTNTDVDALTRTEVALRDSEAQFRNIVEHLPIPVLVYGEDGEMRLVSRMFTKVTGYTIADVPTRDTWGQRAYGDQASEVRALVQTAIGEKEHVDIGERWVRTKSGERRRWWVQLTPTAPDRTGKTVFVGMAVDVTERHDAIEHKNFLLSELAHRMKNQLAVIQSISGQTARNAGSLQQFQEDFAQRLQGLGVATDVLMSQGWKGASLAELVKRQLAAFMPTAERLECQGPDVTISTDATQSIGLALHELATNAVKYGAWSGTAGRVIVTWQLVSDSPDETSLRLSWLEQGGPPVSAPKRKGFGHVVIESMAGARIGGSTELAFAPDGVSWVLTIPQQHFSESQSKPGAVHDSHLRREISSNIDQLGPTFADRTGG